VGNCVICFAFPTLQRGLILTSYVNKWHHIIKNNIKRGKLHWRVISARWRLTWIRGAHSVTWLSQNGVGATVGVGGDGASFLRGNYKLSACIIYVLIFVNIDRHLACVRLNSTGPYDFIWLYFTHIINLLQCCNSRKCFTVRQVRLTHTPEFTTVTPSESYYPYF